MKAAIARKQEPSAIHILGFGIAISLMGDGTLMTVLPQAAFSAQLALTLNMVAWALAINRIVRLGFNPLAGRLLQCFPRRILLVPALGLGALSALLCSLGGFTWVMAGRILWGFVWAGLWVGGSAVVLDISTQEQRGRMNGLFQMWFFIGVGGSSFFGAWLAEVLGLSRALQISAGLMLLGCLIWLFFLPETGIRHPIERQQRSSIWSDLEIRRTVAVTSFPMFINRFLFAGILAVTAILWLETYVGQGLQLGNAIVPLATLAGAFSASRTLVSLFSTPLTGRVSDRLGRRWPVMAGVLALGALGCGLMSLSLFPFAILGLLLSAVTSGGIQTLLNAWIGDQVMPEKQEVVLGTLFSVGDVGSSLGPIAGLTWVQYGSIPGLYRFAAVLLIAGAGYAWVVARRWKN